MVQLHTVQLLLCAGWLTKIARAILGAPAVEIVSGAGMDLAVKLGSVVVLSLTAELSAAAELNSIWI